MSDNANKEAKIIELLEHYETKELTEFVRHTARGISVELKLDYDKVLDIISLWEAMKEKKLEFHCPECGKLIGYSL